MVRRKSLLFLAVGMAMGVGGWLIWRDHGRRTSPNILLITLDTTRADRIGCYGHAPARTPALDGLAQGGVLFERAYASAPLTLPSHASIFSGLYSPEHGLRTNGRGKLNSQIPVLSSMLAEMGYDTGAFVGSFVLDSRFGLDGGIAHYDDEIHDSSHAHDVLHRERDGSAVVDSAFAWLKRPRRKPFYCWVHLYDPHSPYDAHEREFGREFRDEPYDGEIAYVDRQVSRLLDYLRKSNQDHQTLVIVVGDHGEGLGDHDERNHGYTLYDSVLRVPLIFHWPAGISAGSRCDSAVSLVDVFPTVCELLGRTAPAKLSGRSFRAALRGNAIAPSPCYGATDDPFLREGWSPLRTLIDQDWKYIRTTKPELFNLAADPDETRNLAEVQPQRLAAMERELAELEARMTARTVANVQLSDRERRILESLGYLGHAIQKPDPDQVAALIDVKDMLRFDFEAQSAHERFENGQAEEAIAQLRGIADRAPLHATSRLFLGQALSSLGRQTEAVSALEEILRIKPDHIDALNELGRIQALLGHFELSADYLKRALETLPDSGVVHLNLGRVLFQQGEFDEAADHLERALLLDPELVDVRCLAGEALRRAGRNEEAVAYLVEELQQDPQSVPARLSLASIYAADDPGEAERLLKECVSLQPDNPYCHFQMGQLLLEENRPSEAIRCFRETQRLMPGHPQVAGELEKARRLAGSRNSSDSQ